MRRSTTAILAALLLLPSVALAQPAKKSTAPFFWRVTRADVPSTLYLLGTFHMGIAPTALPRYVWDRVDDCKFVVTEADIRNINPQKVNQWIVMPKGKDLDKMLGAKAWAKLRKMLPQVPPARLKRLHPFILISMMMAGWLDQTVSIDAHAVTLGVEKKKKLEFLETAEWQLKMITSIGVDKMADELKSFLNEPKKAKKELFALRDTYIAGDFAAMTKKMADPKEIAKYPEWHKKILGDRNRAWVPQLEKHLKTGSVYCAVGAGHMIGVDGLLALFAARGYDIQRVRAAPPKPEPVALKVDAPVARAVRTGWIGVTIDVVRSHVLRFLASSKQGLLVRSVTESSPAAKAGIRNGDVLMTIDGKSIRSMGALRKAVRAVAPGKQMTLTVVRRVDAKHPKADKHGRVTLTLKVRSAKRPN